MAALGPNDLESLYRVLCSVLSSDEATRKEAESALRSLETRPGCCSCLAEIIGSAQADRSARWLAVVHLKNCVVRYWRPRSDCALSAEEKDHLRRKVLLLLEEPDAQLAVQLALVVAKMARQDGVRGWPQLCSELLQRLDSAAPAAAARLQLTLHHVLKELASKRLTTDQAEFRSLTTELLPRTWAPWLALTEQLLPALPQLSLNQPPPPELERWLLLLKCLRRLFVHGLPSDADTAAPHASLSGACPVLLRALVGFLEACQLHGMGSTAEEDADEKSSSSLGGPYLLRCATKLLKTLTDVLVSHPWSLAQSGSLFPLGDWAFRLLVDEDGDEAGASSTRAPPSIAHLGCLFLHSLLSSGPLRGSSSTRAASLRNQAEAKAQAAQAMALAASLAPELEAFWSARREPLARSALRRHLCLSTRELQAWDDSPEEFFVDSSNAAPEDSSRAAAEQLLETLLARGGESLAPALAQEAQAQSQASEAALASVARGSAEDLARLQAAPLASLPAPLMLAVGRKQAALRALCLAASALHDALDAGAWLREGGVLRACGAGPRWLLPVRREALAVPAYLLGSLSGEDRVALYGVLLAAVRERRGAEEEGKSSLALGDPCVRLTASRTLRSLVDDWGWEEDAFVSCGAAAASLEGLAELLGDCDEYDAQLAAASCLALVVDRLGEAAAPGAPALAARLPRVWARASERPLLRLQVLLTLARLVAALGDGWATAVGPVVFGALEAALDPAHPDAPTLLEDAANLWLVAMRNAPGSLPLTWGADESAEKAADSQTRRALLHALWPRWLALARASTEHVDACARLATSALFLGGAEFWGTRGEETAEAISRWLPQVNDRGLCLLLPVLETAALLCPAAAVEARLLPSMRPALVWLLTGLVSSTLSSLVSAPATALLARLALADARALCAWTAAEAPALAALACRAWEEARARQHADDTRDATALTSLLRSWAPQNAHQTLETALASLPAQDLANLILQSVMDAWISRFDATLKPQARRRSALALCALWELPLAGLPERLGAMLAHVAGVWAEGAEEGPGVETRAAELGVAVASDEAGAEYARREQTAALDPAAGRALAPAVRAALEAARGMWGAEVDAALGGMEPELAAQVQEMMRS